jgi:hypothetical protein
MHEGFTESIRKRQVSVPLRLVPFLMLCYFIDFVDRVNAGFARAAMNSV